MSDAIVIKTEDEEHKEESNAERTIGKLESEVEHQEKKLEEHTDTLESVKDLQSWIQTQVDDLRRELRELPMGASQETVANLLERIEKLEKPVTESAASLTEPPVRAAEQEVKATHGILDRLASAL